MKHSGLESIPLCQTKYAAGMRRTQKQTMACTSSTLLALVRLCAEPIMMMRQWVCAENETSHFLIQTRYAPGMRRTQKQTKACTRSTLIALVWLCAEPIMTSMRC